MATAVPEAPLPLALVAKSYATHEASIGADYGRRNGLKRVNQNAIAYIAGNAVKVQGAPNSRLSALLLSTFPLPPLTTSNAILLPLTDLLSGAVRYILGRDGGGIGGFDVHPTGSHIAVAERSSTNAAPHVFLYAIPSLELTHVLCGGTERAYSDVSFSGNGEKIVTVGSFPDFLLSVWDWREQRNVLKTKAFGQEVRHPALLPAPEAVRRTYCPHCFCCGCSAGLQRPLLGRRRRAHPDVRHRPRALLAHGGDLHWPQAAGGPADDGVGAERVEALTRARPLPCLPQGDIGKFGRVDLSDVTDFCVLADGKVVTTSESGFLLLWDGISIKTQVRCWGPAPGRRLYAAASQIDPSTPQHRPRVLPADRPSDQEAV